MAEAVPPGAAAADVAPEGIGAEIIAKKKQFDDEKNAYDNLDPATKTTPANIAIYTPGFEYYSNIMKNESKQQSEENITAAKKVYTELLNKLADECITQTKKAETKSDPKADAETKKLCQYFMETLDKTADDIKTTKEIEGKLQEIQSFMNILDSEQAAVPPKTSSLPKESSDVTDEEIQKATTTLNALFTNEIVKKALARAVASANKIVLKEKKKEEPSEVAGGTQRVGTKKRKRRKRRGKGTGKNKPLSEVNVVL